MCIRDSILLTQLEFDKMTSLLGLIGNLDGFFHSLLIRSKYLNKRRINNRDTTTDFVYDQPGINVSIFVKFWMN